MSAAHRLGAVQIDPDWPTPGSTLGSRIRRRLIPTWLMETVFRHLLWGTGANVSRASMGVFGTKPCISREMDGTSWFRFENGFDSEIVECLVL